MLFFKSIPELKVFISENYVGIVIAPELIILKPTWDVDMMHGKVHFHKNASALHASLPLPAVIQNTLSYAVELERIV